MQKSLDTTVACGGYPGNLMRIKSEIQSHMVATRYVAITDYLPVSSRSASGG
jgi:hypothetical protein